MSWDAVEADVVALLRQSSALRTEAQNCRMQAREEMKSRLLGLVEVVDAFDRVFANIGAKENDADKQTKIWIGNFRSVRKRMEALLKEAGVSKIESLKDKATPGLHTVVETVEDPDAEDDIIVEELERGYLWGEEVLRKASVKVVANKNGENNRL
jgi:molecular chaperone GrpE